MLVGQFNDPKILKEQSDLGLHYLLFCLHILDTLLYGKTTILVYIYGNSVYLYTHRL